MRASALARTVVVLAACSAPARQPAPAPTPTPVTAPPAPDAAPAPTPRNLIVTEPPGGAGGLQGPVVAARIFAFSDTQLHYLFGKRTFAQSPFADISVEVAVRPVALDDGSDLLLQLFLDDLRAHYADAVPVFLGDAADLSCEQELDAFLARTGEPLLAITSNHDGFYVGNFTSRDDVDGKLAVTDMPNDWTRACSLPGDATDRRLTRGRAIRRLAAALPPGPAWATEVVTDGGLDPHAYGRAYLYYLRPLAMEPAVWGVFVDTADYRRFDLRATQGAGTVGSISHEQLRFLDRGMFEADAAAYVVFGHHPIAELEAGSRARLEHFLDQHPTIVAYVSAHTHVSMERTIALPSGRAIPELIVGSTTDAPQAARLLEVHVDPAGGLPAIASWRLMLDRDRLCAGVAPLPPTSTGYTGYRILRDGTPLLDVGMIEGLLFVLGLDDLAAKKLVQAEGALLIENELVRSWAELYLGSPLALSAEERAALEAIVGRRYAAGDTLADITPYLRGTAAVDEVDGYDRWHDPVNAAVLAVAEKAVHRFGPHLALFSSLRARRTETAEAARYFACHALFASTAEATSRKRVGDVEFIR